VGYLTAHKDLQVMDSNRPLDMEIVLQRDPAALNLDVAEAIISPKARKEAKRAISLLKSQQFAKAEKQLDEAYKLAPTSAELNFLLGYLYYQKKDLRKAATYLTTAATLNSRNGQALALLGRTQLERQDYAAARSVLEQALMVDPEPWLPHSLLADAHLHQKSYEKALEESELAIRKGQAAASFTQLIRGESLAGLGRDQEAIQALNTFLQSTPRSPIAPQVRSLIVQIQEHTLIASANTPSIPAVHISGVDPLAALPAEVLSIKPWQPPGIDENKVPTAAGVVCPSARVIEESGKRVQELVHDVERFAAVEDLFHQTLDSYGIPVRSETRKYNYVASITETQPGVLNVDEYPAEKLTLQGYPDQIASQGFAALALVFHPDRRDEFFMTCEGLGESRGQATWLVRFQQREDRPNRMHAYKLGNQEHPVPLKRRAWITADKFQIARIEAEMVKPMPEIQLISEHQIVEYGPIPFPKKNMTLWLPKSADIYFDFRKHHYYRRHSFDHYMLYSVETEEKRKEPGVARQN
jgi:tetratricopeptide (TPR) repeat protein